MPSVWVSFTAPLPSLTMVAGAAGDGLLLEPEFVKVGGACLSELFGGGADLAEMSVLEIACEAAAGAGPAVSCDTAVSVLGVLEIAGMVAGAVEGAAPLEAPGGPVDAEEEGSGTWSAT